ncbi:MAG TPA: hypothetical protein VH500_25440 [Nitrososphaeraceae archaeon]|jgi:hypothetical protein
MTNTKDEPSEYCAECQKEITELKKTLVETRDEYSYQYRQHEDEISSMVEDLPTYRRWLAARARLEELSEKYRLKNQSMKTMLKESDSISSGSK